LIKMLGLTKQDFRALAFLWLCGAGMRITMLAVPPILPFLAADLNMSGTEIGFLNGLPIVLFAIAALPGSLVISRLGALPTLILGLLVAAVGGAMRAGSRGVGVLYATTILMGAGLAIAQPALPTLVRQWMPSRIGLATAAYSNGMVVGPIAPVSLSLPFLLPLVGGWPGVLAAWSLPVLVIAAVIFFVAPNRSHHHATSVGPSSIKWNNSLVWRLGFIFAGTNSVYFGGNAFIPGYLAGAVRPDLISPVLAAFNLGQLPATFLLGMAAQRLERKIWPFVLTGIMIETGLVGMLSTASHWTIFWAAWLGFFNGTSLVFGLALPALLSASADVARLSAGMFTISYSFAMGIAVASGAAWDLSGDARFAFLPIALSALPIAFLAPTIPFRTSRIS
jgi:CP family cyanate transporter-like MFS transporter